MKNNLIDALVKINNEELISFHMPGHKNNKDFFKEKLKSLDLIDIDITEIPEADNLHNPKNSLLNSQNRLSKFYDSYKSYFLVNGSTSGILSMIFATTKRNDKILVNRNAHQSVINGILLNGLQPVYIMPEIDEKTGMVLGIHEKILEEKLSSDETIKTVLLTYPSYEGICFDIKKVSKIVKKYDCYLIIDEAHGSHLLSHEKLPVSACKSGADIVVQSAHKNLPAFTQGAFLHLYNKKLEYKIEKYLKIFQSSSPSYIIMASLDASVDYLFTDSHNAMEKLLVNIEEFISKLKKTNYNVVNWGIYSNRSSFSFDSTKIVISALPLGINGNTLEKILRYEFGIQVEYSTSNFVLLITTILNESQDFEKLLRALLTIQDKYKKKSIKPKKVLMLKDIEVKIRPSNIDDYNFIIKDVNECLGKIAYESVIPYPPGIPLINPGELITKDALKQLRNIVTELKIIEE